MPSRNTVETMIKEDRIPNKRLPMVSTSIDLTGSYATHAGKTIRTTVKNIDFTLPLATAGQTGATYTFLVGVAATTGQGATLKVTSADKINSGTSGKGLISAGSTDAVGDAVTVISDGSNYWTIGSRGTWTAQP